MKFPGFKNLFVRTFAKANEPAQGVIGRMFSALSPVSRVLPSGAQAYKTAAYSAAGNAKILEGARDLPRMLGASTLLYSRREELRDEVHNLTRRESHSMRSMARSTFG